jgi:electron transfer flavoprotein alpha subunit
MSGAVLAFCDGSSPVTGRTGSAFALRLAAEAGSPAHLVYTGAPDWEDHGWGEVWRLESADARRAAAALATLIESHRYAAVVTGDSVAGREVAGRLAGKLRLPLAARVLSARPAGEAIEVVRAVDGSRRSARLRLAASPALLVVDADADAALPASGSGKRIEGRPLAAPGPASPVACEERSLGPYEIEPREADTVVAGGRGLGAEGFALAEELARLLGGAVGASRVAVDMGWAPRSCQVGMTGQVVQPRLYIAAGISGAVHHVFGMKDSGFVVAINKDPAAPIFQAADAAIVGDACEVLAALVRLLKEARTVRAGGHAAAGAVA